MEAKEIIKKMQDDIRDHQLENGFNTVFDFLNEDLAELESLQSPPPTNGAKDRLPEIEELWDDHSEYLDTDIDSLQMQVGTNWMERSQFIKALESYASLPTKLPTEEEITKTAVEQSEHLSAQEQSFYLAGFQEAFKWLLSRLREGHGESKEKKDCTCEDHLTITFTKNGDFCGNCGKEITTNKA